MSHLPNAPGSMSGDTPASQYAQAASDADARIDEELANLRHRSDAGEISPQQAAQERIDLMENHLARIKALREVYFGSDADPGWTSGTCSTL